MSSLAGKTTLLDVLGGRKNTGVMTGAVFLNGYPTRVHTRACYPSMQTHTRARARPRRYPKNARTFNRSASYCEQVCAWLRGCARVCV